MINDARIGSFLNSDNETLFWDKLEFNPVNL